MSEIANAEISACCSVNLEINTRDAAEPPNSSPSDAAAANGRARSFSSTQQLLTASSANGSESTFSPRCTSSSVSNTERRSIVEIVVQSESAAPEAQSPKEEVARPTFTPGTAIPTSTASFAIESQPGTPDDLLVDQMAESASACSSPPLELSSPSKESACPLGTGAGEQQHPNDAKEQSSPKPLKSKTFSGSGGQNFSSNSIFAEFNSLVKKGTKSPGGGAHGTPIAQQTLSLASKAYIQRQALATGYARTNSAIDESKALHERLKQSEENCKRHSSGEDKSQRSTESAAADANAVVSSSLKSEQSLESLLEDEYQRPRTCSIGSGDGGAVKDSKLLSVGSVAPECMSLKEEGLLDGSGSKTGRGVYMSRLAGNATASALYRLKSGAPLNSALSARFARYTSKAEYFSNAYPSLYGAPGGGSGADGELSENAAEGRGDAPDIEGLSVRGQSPANLSRLSDTSTTNLLDATARAEKTGRSAPGNKEDEHLSSSSDECDSAIDPLAPALGKRVLRCQPPSSPSHLLCALIAIITIYSYKC